MLSYFKSLQPSSIFTFIVAFILLKLPFFFGAVPTIKPMMSFWYFLGGVEKNSILLNILPAQICLLGQAVWLNYLFHKADYHEGRSMIPALYFTLLTTLIPSFNILSIYTVITFVLLMLFQTFISIASKENSRAECFNAGIIGGILCLINTHFILFIPFLFLILYAIKPFRFNEYVMMVFGMFFPVYCALVFSYLFDKSININILRFERFHIEYIMHNIFNSINIILTIIYLLLAFVSMQGILYSTGFKRKRNIKMLIFLFLGLLLIIILSGDLDETILSLMFIPVSIFLTFLMLRIRKKRLSELLNLIFVLVTFITNVIRLIK
ncbi:MAG: hypothetical protein RJA25_934 [Bacteroidota bacterium]|jgi:hypothetical protein